MSGCRRGHGEMTAAAAGQWWTCECRDGWKGMEGPGIEAAEAAAEGLAEALDHSSDAGNVVVGGADEGEEALDGVLPQHPHPCRQDAVRGLRVRLWPSLVAPWGRLTWEVIGHLVEQRIGRPPGTVQGR